MIYKGDIPYGDYCYEISSVDESTGKIKIFLCPYWYRRPDKPDQSNGYCAFLDLGDWENDEGFGLLWDQVKECQINRYEDNGT